MPNRTLTTIPLQLSQRACWAAGQPISELMAQALAQGPFGMMNKPFGEADIIAAVNCFLRITKTKTRR